jgi:hypothetical protein
MEIFALGEKGESKVFHRAPLFFAVLQNRSRNRNRRNRIILTQEEPEPEPYPCSRFRLRFRFLLQKKYQTKSTLTGHWPTHTYMKLPREETKIKVTGRRFYRKNNLKFEGRTGTGAGTGTGA